MGVFLSYVTAKGHTLIDRELSLPLDWCEDRDRCRAAGIPDSVRFRTKPELAVQMLERLWQAQLPISWVVADTVYGGNLDLRTWLEAHQYPYVLAVACNEPVGIMTLDGQRRRLEVSEVEPLRLGAHDWQRLSMSAGTKGPRLFDWAAVPMLHRWENDGCHWVLIRRSLTDPNEKAYYFVFAPKGTTLPEMVAAIGARWHIEEDFENAKDLGLDHYEVRCFIGWYRHITLVLVALAFLTGICATERFSTSPPDPSELPARPAVLPLTVDSRAPSACTAHLALFFVRTPGPGLVVVASLPPKSCQLLPHQTSSQDWLILAGSKTHCSGLCAFQHAFPRDPRNFLEVPEFLEICFVLSPIVSFLERSSEYDSSSSCRRQCSSAGYSSQDPAPLAQRGPCALGRTPQGCTYEMCGAGTPAAGGAIA